MEEAAALAVAPDEANTARLVWSAGGQSYSISVYLCRDYLTPYDNARTSQLDWDRPGLNLVIMNSAQTSLFEGQAAFDVRRLRGPGKFVALCNCAGTMIDGEGNTGTSLLGPTKSNRRLRGDIIEQLPADAESLLIADLDLQDIALVEIKPDKHVHDPLGTVRRFRVVWDQTEGKARLDPLLDIRPAERGVWHPAFLKVVQRHIALLLYPSSRYRAVKDAVEASRVRHVSGASLTGIFDVLFRLYEPDAATEDFPKVPYRTLTDEELGKIVRTDQLMKLAVQPEQIYKYRTVPVPRVDHRWGRKKAEIERLLPKRPDNEDRHRLLNAACRLARDWNDTTITDEQRRQVEPFFLEQHELVPRLGRDSGNTLRQRLVLVQLSPDANWEIFENAIIRDWLSEVQDVRSIYRLSRKQGWPEFHVWIDIIADPYDADAIVAQLESRCEDLNIEIGVRSMDVMEHLIKESVEGVYNGDFGEKAKAFLDSLHPQMHQDLDVALTRELHNVVLAFADAWFDQSDGDPNDQGAVQEKTTAFYQHFFCGNFSKSPDARKDHLRQAGTAWHDIYQILELNCTTLLLKALGVRDRADLGQALSEYFGPKRGVDFLHQIKDNTIRALLEYMNAANLEFQDVGMKEWRREISGNLAAFRNAMTHEDRRTDRLRIVQKPSQEQIDAVREIGGLTQVLLDMERAVSESIRLGGITPSGASA
jgi:hypothetical protein